MTTLIQQFIKELPQGENCDIKAIINGDRDYLLYRDTIIGIDDNINIMKIPQDASVEIIDATACKITMGLFDTHVHGGYGCYFNSCKEYDLRNLLLKLPKHGVTSILPTIMTSSDEETRDAIARIKKVEMFPDKGACRIEGIHLEGPYIAARKAGVHPINQIKAPSIKHYESLYNPVDDIVKMVTIAPEIDKDKEFIKYLKGRDIIPAAGHSEASPAHMEEINHVTHLFNAMPQMNHRKPSMTSDALYRDDVNVEVIADGVHLDYDTLKLILKIKNDENIIFISDCLPIAYSAKQSARFAGGDVQIRNNRVLNPDGTLAGCLKFLDDIGYKLIKDELINFNQFIQYASINPMKIFNLPYKLAVGSVCDIVLWRFNRPYKTIVAGQLVDA